MQTLEPGSPGEPRYQLDRGHAQRAASCVLTPQPGDLVLIAERADAKRFILAVLTRASVDAAVLSVPNATTMLLSASDITLAAARDVAVQAPSITVDAQVGRFSIVATHFIGDAATMILNTAEALYTSLQTYAERLISKAGYALRLVDAIDSTVAGTVLVQAKETYSVQATHALVTATQDTRLDGERISMG